MLKSIDMRIAVSRHVMRALAPFALVLFGSTACSQTGGTPSAEKAAATGTPVSQEPPAAQADSSITDATNFHLLDFVAWNNRNIDMFRRLHTADVKVDFAGKKTEGIDAHVQALLPMWQPNFKVLSHSPIIAEGEWTCTVGSAAPPAKTEMVTVARWRGGAISEEYILLKLLAAGVTPPETNGKPVVSISNRDPATKALVGAELGWSCRLERTADQKMVITVAKAGGTPAEQMVFTQ